MKIINYPLVREFASKHPDSASALKAWYELASKSAWKNLVEVRHIYPHADLYKCCTIFNIGGNKYRLIAVVNYRAQVITINNILTHADYDKEKWKKNCAA